MKRKAQGENRGNYESHNATHYHGRRNQGEDAGKNNSTSKRTLRKSQTTVGTPLEGDPDKPVVTGITASPAGGNYSFDVHAEANGDASGSRRRKNNVTVATGDINGDNVKASPNSGAVFNRENVAGAKSKTKPTSQKPTP
ncbi:MAG TPA: hypothetical protein VNN73_09425 [Blastocatellia bacterium]|nr:hypothetical protein [Blastocatellia bacterium]